MNDLLTKLQGMGLKIEKASNLTKSDGKIVNLAQVVDGSWINESKGRVFFL